MDIPRDVKIAMLLDQEKELFDTLDEKGQEDTLNKLDFETMAFAQVGGEMSMAVLRLICKAMEAGIDSIPEEARNATRTIINQLYSTIDLVMKTFMDDSKRCPGCGRIHGDEDESVSIH